MKKYIMALDAGTTSNRCILFDHDGKICSVAQKEFTQYFPKPGWVEHDANEIWTTQLGVALSAMNKIGATAEDIAAIGIANTMVMSIYERTKEIGVMKVLGAELGAIRAMFLTESAMIGLIGGVVGVGLSFLISYLLNNVPIVANLLASLGLSFGNGGAVSIIPWWLVLVAMVFSMMVGVVFGFIPANRAVKISALEAIRHD